MSTVPLVWIKYGRNSIWYGWGDVANKTHSWIGWKMLSRLDFACFPFSLALQPSNTVTSLLNITLSNGGVTVMFTWCHAWCVVWPKMWLGCYLRCDIISGSMKIITRWAFICSRLFGKCRLKPLNKIYIMITLLGARSIHQTWFCHRSSRMFVCPCVCLWHAC